MQPTVFQDFISNYTQMYQVKEGRLFKENSSKTLGGEMVKPRCQFKTFHSKPFPKCIAAMENENTDSNV